MDKSSDSADSRRKFLKTAGKFAVYTPPALLVMTSPGHAWAKNSANNGCGAASGNVAAPGGSEPNNNAQNAQGGQNCPTQNQGKTL